MEVNAAATDASKSLDFEAIDLREVLRNRFQLRSFRRGQRAVIHRLLQGRNVAAVFSTGGGKSLCYQLPSLLFPGITLVVSPLIALMKDQCDSLQRRGIGAIRLDSTQTPVEFRDAMRRVREGQVKLLYVAPERFFNERFIASLSTLDISLFAIDEAHCISQWGHNFRPDYLKLADLTRRFSAKRVLALTATATPAVLSDIKKAFGIASKDAIQTPFYRPNLHLRSVVLEAKDQYTHLVSQIASRPAGATLVYVTTQRTTEEIAARLSDDGITATAYHAGLEIERRTEVQQSFHKSKKQVVVATIAFGMGIDKSNIRYVYHFNPPKSLEAYAQEIGRAGRDGKQSVCELIVVPEDRVTIDNFTFGDTPSRQSVRQMLELLRGNRDEFFVSHYRLSAESDIRIAVVRTLLTYLELDGYLQATSPRYAKYKIQPLVSLQSILNSVTGEQREFFAAVLSHLTKGRNWFLLNVTLAANRLKTDRKSIVAAIEFMAERGWLDVKVSDLSHGYRWVKELKRPNKLADQLTERMVLRETSEVGRLDAVLDLAAARSCQAATLSAHFGDEMKTECGHCSFCLGEGPFEIPAMRPRSLGSSATGIVNDMIAKYPDRMVTARQRARFLCGLSTPAMFRSRMTREDHFGVCSEMPFADVLRAVGGEPD
ncbi:RecQ family ATP-dependent DNA helicase [Novipirellula sp. SH528]|uniref:RecQ family ATP-dependent DNA helicase n=1 Tax=Novipirellula sp. SH528 TaxID=3454466 RepID=UPI003F9EEF17